MPVLAVKMNAAQIRLRSCSWPRNKVRKVNDGYRTVQQSYRSHELKRYHTGGAAEVFMEMCKKSNPEESQGICSLTWLSCQHACLNQLFSIYRFWGNYSKNEYLVWGAQLTSNLLLLLKNKNSSWGSSMSLVLASPECDAQYSTIGVANSSGQGGFPFVLAGS